MPSEATSTGPESPKRPGLASTDEFMNTIRDIVGFAPRTTGSVGGRRTANYVADRFRRAGLEDVHFETATSYKWTARDSSLVVGGEAIDSFPISHSLINDATTPSARTLGPQGQTGEIVDIGSGTIGTSDVKGKWVLFDLKFELPLIAMLPFTNFLWDPYLRLINPSKLFGANPYVTSQTKIVDEAQQAGALGVIGVLSDYFDSNRYHNEYHRRSPMTAPGVWITKKEGARLRSLLPSAPKATMKLTTERKAVTARTVVGFLPGTTKDTVMVQSHHDSQGPGAVEDATGTSEVIALADYYGAEAKKPGYKKRQKTMMFTTFDTHFTGYQQHQAFVKKYITDQETPYRIVANATIEHVGKHATVSQDGSLKVRDEHEPRGIFENLSLALKIKLDSAIVRNNLHTTAVLNSTLPSALLGGIPTDASFVLQAGVPTISLIAGPLYMYDDADTIDKIDQSQLRPVATFFADMLDALEKTPADRIGQSSLLSRLGTR
ncbi:M28 family peptidase [Aeromicrobium fastidiosum]|uniref:M28 family peptidase n=2 Tax=Aeromicrobium fastidiosum TaxID=52699 RepID=A0A641ARW6_9ACTN|nr:M28 family peptidase [Aeromicrobium fastidiosum]